MLSLSGSMTRHRRRPWVDLAAAERLRLPIIQERRTRVVGVVAPVRVSVRRVLRVLVRGVRRLRKVSAARRRVRPPGGERRAQRRLRRAEIRGHGAA